MKNWKIDEIQALSLRERCGSFTNLKLAKKCFLEIFCVTLLDTLTWLDYVTMKKCSFMFVRGTQKKVREPLIRQIDHVNPTFKSFRSQIKHVILYLIKKGRKNSKLKMFWNICIFICVALCFLSINDWFSAFI